MLVSPAHATRQPGAARALRFTWSDPQSPNTSATLQAYSLSQPAFGAKAAAEGKTDQSSIYFTRSTEGTRNLWQATITTDTGETPSTAIGEVLATRNQVLRATPLSHFEAPFFAEQAAPTPDGRALLFVTNALDQDVKGSSAGGSAGNTQIARLDLRNGRMTALTENETRCHSPVVSPDGSRFAFVSDLSGLESVYVMSMNGDDVRRVATLSRKPRWLNATTLVFESIRPGRSGLYRLVLPRQGEDRSSQGRPGEGQQAEPRSSLLFTRSGACAVSPDERQLCVATDAETSATTSAAATSTVVTDRNGVNVSTAPRLYLLAADGSGARAVPATEGARSPSFAPDGSAIVYDAPMDAESRSGNDTSPRHGSPSVANITRTLWFVPMLRVTPTALLLDVRRAENRGMAGQSESMTPTGAGASGEVLEIVGTAFADGDSAPQVRLEWGEGSEPSRWNPLPIRRTPAHQTVLATWRVPSNARGERTLRLTVVDADGDRAESTLPFTLPLAAPAPLTPPLFANLPTSPPDSPPARSGVPAERPLEVVTPVPPSRTPPPLPAPPRLSVPSRLPPPPLPPVVDSRNVAPIPTPPVSAAPRYNQRNVSLSRTIRATSASRLPSPIPLRVAEPDVSLVPVLVAQAAPRPQQASRPPAMRGQKRLQGDAASVVVSGVPITMRVGETVEIEAVLRNIGTSMWTSDSSRPVRLIRRWYGTTGRRNGWQVHWLQSVVRPGSSTRMRIPLTAPLGSGRYRLFIGLVRLNGASYEAPATLPGPASAEFVTVAFTVNVLPSTNLRSQSRQTPRRRSGSPARSGSLGRREYRRDYRRHYRSDR